MKRWWASRLDVQFARVNALSLQKRAFLFLSVISICVALVDRVWFSPAEVEHQQLKQTFDKQNAELKRTRDESKLVTKPVDANQALRDEITAINIHLGTLNQTIGGVTPVVTEAVSLEQVLVLLLRQYDGLKLLRTSVVAPEATISKTSQAPGSVGAGPLVLPSGLTRQGVELTVSGSYIDLMRYVQTLEDALPYARWGSMKLKSDDAANIPPVLTLQLFLLRSL